MKKFVVSIFLNYIRFWAKIALLITSAKIIGVAGSVGKTSTKIALKCVFEGFGRVLITEGNSETGVPLGILGIKQEVYGLKGWLLSALKCPFNIFVLKNVDYLVVEMGTDDFVWPKNMEFLLSVVKPEYVIWLNTSPAHMQQFSANIKDESYERNLHLGRLALANEDGKIITKNIFKQAIINNDDWYIVNALEKYSREKIFTYGLETDNNAYLIDHKIEFPNTKYLINILDDNYSLEFKGQILAKEYWQNFAAVLLLAKHLKLNIFDSVNALEDKWRLPNGRGCLLKAINNSWLIDGSYNSSPDAFAAQFNLFTDVLKFNQNLKPVIVAGDMRELGDVIAPQAHINLAQKISQINAEVYLVGELMKVHVLPFLLEQNIKANWYKNSHELGLALKNNLPEDSFIFIKGSQNTIFLEETVAMVLKNIEDKKYLCRQSHHWEKVRQDYFKRK